MTVESKRYDIGIRKVNMHAQTNELWPETGSNGRQSHARVRILINVQVIYIDPLV